MLDACCYAGGFTLAALAGGARQVVAIDTSARALSWARRNLELNGHLADAIESRPMCEDAGRYLANCSERFDLIVLDPPPLARSRKDVERARRLYVEMNAARDARTAPGGS